MTVYPPREDTFLLLDNLPDVDGKKVLEIGTGNGLIAVEAAKKGADVTATDINPEALEAAKQRAEDEGVEDRIEFLESDLFDRVEGRFDLVLFNPPYLPGEERNGDEKWRGGEKGTELMEKFLDEAPGHLEKGGEILFIASSRADTASLRQEYPVSEKASRKLWFETLYLFKSE